MPSQVGKEIRDRNTRLSPGGDDRQLHAGMPGQQTQQFHPRVAGTPNDSNPDHIGFP